MTGSTGLARVTVSAPGRRLDVALPEHAPLAELLPELLRQAGEGLADAGTGHDGWVLRRADGSALATGTGLAPQGVRDGEVLHLAPARQSWPELEYDDVVEAIAAGARRYGRSWDPAATPAATLGLAALALLAGLVALWRAGTAAGGAGSARPGLIALAVAAVLLFGGTTAARAYGDAVAGAALAGCALPFAFLGALLLAGPGSVGSGPVGPGAVGSGSVGPGSVGPGFIAPFGFTAPQVLLASVALLLASVLGAVGVGHALRVFVAGTVVGLLAAVGALAGYPLPAAGAAAIVLATVVTTLAAVPLAAIRLGRLPVPVLGPAGSAGAVPDRAGAVPDRAALGAAVVRADEMLTGLLAGAAVAAAGAAVLVARSGGAGGRVLVAVAATVLLLRARLFPTVRGRVPLLLSGVTGYLLLLGAPVLGGAQRDATVATAVLVPLAAVLVLAGSVYRRRAPGPYLGRTADVLDVLCVISVIPAACAVLGLYGALRGLAG